jgi:hypothetical protein
MKYLDFSKEFHCDGLSENNLEKYIKMLVVFGSDLMKQSMILRIQSVSVIERVVVFLFLIIHF